MQGCVHNEALGLWLTAMIFHAKIVIILVGVFWPSDYYEYIGEYFWPSSAPVQRCLPFCKILQAAMIRHLLPMKLF